MGLYPSDNSVCHVKRLYNGEGYGFLPYKRATIYCGDSEGVFAYVLKGRRTEGAGIIHPFPEYVSVFIDNFVRYVELISRIGITALYSADIDKNQTVTCNWQKFLTVNIVFCGMILFIVFSEV